MTHNNVLADKTITFAIRIVNCYNYLVDTKKEFTMSKQMFRSGTSIGANVHEAIQGQQDEHIVERSKRNLFLAGTSSQDAFF